MSCAHSPDLRERIVDAVGSTIRAAPRPRISTVRSPRPFGPSSAWIGRVLYNRLGAAVALTVANSAITLCHHR